MILEEFASSKHSDKICEKLYYCLGDNVNFTNLTRFKNIIENKIESKKISESFSYNESFQELLDMHSYVSSILKEYYEDDNEIKGVAKDAANKIIPAVLDNNVIGHHVNAAKNNALHSGKRLARTISKAVPHTTRSMASAFIKGLKGQAIDAEHGVLPPVDVAMNNKTKSNFFAGVPKKQATNAPSPSKEKTVLSKEAPSNKTAETPKAKPSQYSDNVNFAKKEIGEHFSEYSEEEQKYIGQFIERIRLDGSNEIPMTLRKIQSAMLKIKGNPFGNLPEYEERRLMKYFGNIYQDAFRKTEKSK